MDLFLLYEYKDNILTKVNNNKKKVIAFSGKIHAIIGFTIWVFFPQLNLPIVVIGSLFPDTDHHKAIMGKIFPLWLIGFKHRGLTHTILFAFIFSITAELLCGGIGVSFFTGYVSHLIGDKLSSKRK